MRVAQQGTQEQADEAVKKYNGGILELTMTASKANGKDGASSEAEIASLVLFPNSQSLTVAEDRLGPLFECGLVRGEGWVTIFRNAMASELKKHRGDAVEWKGSFIKVNHLEDRPLPL